jgi:NADPH-dependent curcumin reductase CurA
MVIGRSKQLMILFNIIQCAAIGIRIRSLAMISSTNKKVVLTSSIEGRPRAEDFRIIEEAVTEPQDGEILVRHIYLSLDPYQRPAIAGRYATSPKPMGEGDMPTAETVGQVIASRHTGFAEGRYVRHFGGWQEYSISDGSQVFPVDPDRAALSTYLGVLGMPGLTAYASIIKLAEVQEGQTVLVSAAAGPVGATLGQIAMQKGASVIGIAGSDEKCAYVTNELGFADCVNYKDSGYPDSLTNALAEGADIYHDNVGGEMLEQALRVLKPYGTVILCGLMSQYNDPDQANGLYLGLPIMKRAVMKGLVVFDFEDQREEFFDLVAPWVQAGQMKYREDRAFGIENTGIHFARLMSGNNFGKALVVLDPE